MASKKSLETKIRWLEERLESEQKLRNDACNKVYSERRHHQDQLDAMAQKQFPLDWHLADGSPGKPICLAGHYDNDEGFSVELYLDKEGNVIGIVILDRGNLDSLRADGMVPAEIFSE